MKKRLIAMLLTLTLLAGMPAYALEKAASLPDWDALKRYASFEENGTVWTVRSNQTEAALVRISGETAPYSGYACFGLELTGDSATGITVPVLTFYYAGSVKLNGTTASIAVNGARYDIALYSEPVTLGKNAAEKLTAPLNEEGLALIGEMLAAEEVVIALQGDSTFLIEPEEKKTYANTREELAARSMDGLADMLREFNAIEAYDLWDLNEAWWERTRGVEPMMKKTVLPAEDAEAVEEPVVELEEPMYMLSRGAVSSAVRDLQELLIEGGYLQGKADGAYGEGTVRAVRAAQMYLGLMPTGSADQQLIDILTGAPLATEAETVSAEAVELHTAEGLCEMTVGRCWFADAVESTGGDRRSVSDKDDTLIVYEGTVSNLSTDDLDFYWQISAVVRSGDYEYPCVLVCERNEGASLTTSLPPQGEARLLVYAEIPEVAAGKGEWTLAITAGDAEFVIE